MSIQCPKQRFGVARKTVQCTNKNFDVAPTVIWCRQKQVDITRKSVSCQQKKLMLHKNNISCQQKQDDPAQKKYFVLKKVINFYRNSASYLRIDTHTYRRSASFS